MRLRAVLIGVGATAALAAGAVALWPAADAGPAIPTMRVERQPLRREVPADGNLRAVEAAPLLAPQDARMPLKIAWMVPDGSRVTAGEVVIRFDPSEMQTRLADGRDSAAQARRRIAKERTSGAAAAGKRDRQAAMADAEMRAARDFERKDEQLFSRHEIVESQIDTELAGAKMEHARAVKKIERSVVAGNLEVLGVQEKQSAMAIERAETALANLEVSAPNAGILTYQRDWRGKATAVGDTVWPGQKLAEVPDTGAMEAEVYVLEADGGGLTDGLPATLVLEAQPGVTYEAHVARVDPLAEPRFHEVPVQYFKVVLSLARTDPEVMKIGQRVRATIVLGEDDALVVPRQAVFSVEGEHVVFRRGDDGQFEMVSVELGAATAGRVSISTGLAEGDEIALADPRPAGALRAAKGTDEAR